MMFQIELGHGRPALPSCLPIGILLEILNSMGSSVSHLRLLLCIGSSSVKDLWESSKKTNNPKPENSETLAKDMSIRNRSARKFC